MNKHIKIIQKGFEGYSGQIGQYLFADGVSTEAMSVSERDRMAAVGNFVEIEEDGSETPCGAAHRLVRDSAMRAPVPAPMERMSEAEKTAEDVHLIEAAHDAEARPVHTIDELEKVLEAGGVTALREIGVLWNVKDRSAVVLMQKILDAQAGWKAGAAARLQEKIEAIAALGAAEPTPEPSPAPTADDAQAALLNAAISGDLGAALVIDGPIVAEKIEAGVVTGTDEPKE